MVLIRGFYGVVYSTIIIGMFRYIIIIIYEVPTVTILPRTTHKRGLRANENTTKGMECDSCWPDNGQ